MYVRVGGWNGHCLPSSLAPGEKAKMIQAVSNSLVSVWVKLCPAEETRAIAAKLFPGDPCQTTSQTLQTAAPQTGPQWSQQQGSHHPSSWVVCWGGFSAPSLGTLVLVLLAPPRHGPTEVKCNRQRQPEPASEILTGQPAAFCSLNALPQPARS